MKHFPGTSCIVYRTAITLTLVSVLTACGQDSEERAGVATGTATDTSPSPEDNFRQHAEFRCGDNLLSIRIAADGSAKLKFDGTDYSMVHVEAASGARYQDLENLQTYFWNKGNRAMFVIAGRQQPECELLGEAGAQNAAVSAADLTGIT